MKTVFIQADGLASVPLQELNGRSPLHAASTPNLDELAGQGEYGYLRLPVEANGSLSDIMHLALLGYDPSKYYSGPGPFEAASLEVVLEKHDVAFLCHLVTLRSNESKHDGKKFGPHLIMEDDHVGDLEAEEARELIDAINDQMGSETIQFYTGKGHRHVMVWAGGMPRLQCGDPRVAVGKSIGPFLPTGEGSEILKELIEASHIVLRNHEVNRERQEAGLKPVNCFWLWGPGKAVDLPKMTERWSLSGATVSTVDLHLGIGICAGMEPINPEQYDGFAPLDFGFFQKACSKALQTKDFVYLHVPIPSEAESSKAQEMVNVVQAFDEELIGPLVKTLSELGDYRVMVTCNYPAHNTERPQTGSIPFVLYKSGETRSPEPSVNFHEDEGAKGCGRDAIRFIERLLGSQ